MMTGKAEGPQKLWVIRHGQSKSNVAHDEADASGALSLNIDVGNHMVPLSDLGHEQAADLGAWFATLPEDERPEVVIVSPFLRAVQTGDETLAAAGISKDDIIYVVDERLREKSFGILDNFTKPGIKKHFPQEHKRFKMEGKFYCQPPGGESWADVTFRLRAVREEIRARFAGKRVAIFCHQVVVQCWRLIEEDISVEDILAIDRDRDVPNCGVVSYSAPASGEPFAKMEVDQVYFSAPKRNPQPAPVSAQTSAAATEVATDVAPEEIAVVEAAEATAVDAKAADSNETAPLDGAKESTVVPVVDETAKIKSVNSEKPSILYPAIEPFCTGFLKVGDGHEIYFEECGNPDGKPVVFVHGGPGGGIAPGHRQFFDPQKYRIILFDQRGCGKSRPYASLENNTTWDLVSDMEKLRKHFGIKQWLVFGGSWGSTLALAYAETHPESVSELVLRGIFLVRKKEIDWFYQRGASEIFADAWEPYLAHIPEDERADLVAAYHKRLTSDDPEVRVAAARVWSIWEGSTSKLFPDTNLVQRFADATFAEAFARIECHYFVNRGFMRNDSQLLDDAHKIKHIPTVIVQGRYDVVCPMTSAWDLHRALPEAQFVLVSDAGHSAHEPGITAALIAATDKFVV